MHITCSDELRRALNLKKNQLPQYIYQMRTLGYPPGYLADAQVCTSGISMFDRHGKGRLAKDEGVCGKISEVKLDIFAWLRSVFCYFNFM